MGMFEMEVVGGDGAGVMRGDYSKQQSGPFDSTACLPFRGRRKAH